MCGTCGCDDHADGAVLTDLDRGERRPVGGIGLADHDHDHDHHHDHDHELVRVERDLLDRNRAVARDNERWLQARGVVAVSLMGSPGAGKTTLLERTVGALRRPVCVVEGDQETTLDAERLRAAGARVVQIETGTVCHLDARMVRGALEALEPPPGGLVFLENVGNLVCPALFELGERARVVVLSAAEGDDKPRKYPHAFRSSAGLVVSKIDLAPYVEFDLEACLGHARALRPDLATLALSARTGEGISRWIDWLETVAGARS